MLDPGGDGDRRRAMWGGALGNGDEPHQCVCVQWVGPPMHAWHVGVYFRANAKGNRTQS